MLKTIFWIAITLATAYLIDEIRIGDRTIKEHLDRVVHVTGLDSSKDKLQGWIDDKVGDDSPKRQPAEAPRRLHPELERILREVEKSSAANNANNTVPTKDNQMKGEEGTSPDAAPKKEELTEEDQKKLLELLQKF